MEDKDAIILQLRQENAELKKIIEELNRRIADLEERLRLNSQNSSKPPSSDRYPKKDPPSSDKKERKIAESGIHSSTVFLKLGNRADNIHKQYLIKNSDGTSLTQEIFKEKIEQFTESLELEVGEQLTSCNHYAWVILLKDSKNEYHCIYKANDERCNGKQGSTTHQAAVIRARACLQEMNFPSLSTYVKDSEFIPGDFYQPVV